MTKSLPASFMLSIIRLESQLPTPLYRQIYEALRQAIITRHLDAGVRLPSTRDLAEVLLVSRNTVINAIDQLIAEGYLESRTGSGTFVTSELPEESLSAFVNHTPPEPHPLPKRDLSEHGTRYDWLAQRFSMPRVSPPPSSLAFNVGVPDLRAFPFEQWGQMAARHFRDHPPLAIGSEQGLAGYLPLREAVAEYLRVARGVRCETEQVFITAGTQQSLYMAVRLLCNAGDAAWVENPLYSPVRNVLYAEKISLVPIPVDDEGLDVEAGIHQAPHAKLVYVTPSHQFPTGSTLSLARRMKLLHWAEQAGAWILEDDYDSEFRYSGYPLASLQGLDVHNRVVYMGTFSKVLFPGLRLGYVVAPPDLVKAFVGARAVMGYTLPLEPQAITTQFIREGHFTRHIRRMRKLYAERRDAFMEEAARYLGGLLEFGPSDAGMHVIAWLPAGTDDRQVWEAAARQGLRTPPASTFYVGNTSPRQGLLLGFSPITPDEIRTAMPKLAQAIEEVMTQSADSSSPSR